MLKQDGLWAIANLVEAMSSATSGAGLRISQDIEVSDPSGTSLGRITKGPDSLWGFRPVGGSISFAAHSVEHAKKVLRQLSDGVDPSTIRGLRSVGDGIFEVEDPWGCDVGQVVRGEGGEWLWQPLGVSM